MRRARTALLALILLLTACAPAAPPPPLRTPALPPPAPSPVAPLAALHAPTHLLTTERSLTEDEIIAVRARVPHLAVVRTGSLALAGSEVSALGVDPSSFRGFAPRPTAEADGVWASLARGEALASHGLAARLGLRLGGPLQLAAPTSSATLRLGALAALLPDHDLLLDDLQAERLGLLPASGLVLSAPEARPALVAELRALLGPGVSLTVLSPERPDPIASLTGTSLARALGGFSYRPNPDGSLSPDPSWVRAQIRTSSVPIFGSVTCHRLMLPQLAGALAEVEARGLAGSLSTYDGCYVPRFIGSDPTRPLSLHSWGIAVDFDAQTNMPGAPGTMDPRVVAVFKRWGFRWGGDWVHPDPMHFELVALRTPR